MTCSDLQIGLQRLTVFGMQVLRSLSLISVLGFCPFLRVAMTEGILYRFWAIVGLISLKSGEC